MNRRTPLVTVAALATATCVALVAAPSAVGKHGFDPGASGVGDPYYPLDGNGGYDVDHYALDISYAPATGRITGVARIRAKATQDLSRFNLDLDGLTVRSVRVAGSVAGWSRASGELTVTPRRGIVRGRTFTTEIRYDGVPVPVTDLGFPTGVMPTDDGAVILGEPHVASTWFPVNDHPTDKATYTIALSVPAGLEAISNGALQSKRTAGGRTTWTWDAHDPMASYLATAAIGQFEVTKRTDRGLRYWDAVDSSLYDDPTPRPRTGTGYAWSQQTSFEGASYKRLTHVVDVPAGGGNLSFWVDRDTEDPWDFMFVEAHTVGQDDWTTLPDANGHTTDDTGFSCPFWHELHPFLTHYQSDNGDGSCSPTGDTGSWWAATGDSGGYEQWRVNLAPYAGQQVEVSISYASDDVVQRGGVFVDDVVVSTGQGTTSFEDGTLGGWQVPGAPAGSAPNENDWAAFDADDVQFTPIGEHVDASFAREPEIVRFLASQFGAYPFATSGGIVDVGPFGFALETQTRPVYAVGWFLDGPNDGVLVHELAHQWYGDHVAVQAWKNIWLNEGFATYAELLWSEHEGFDTPQETFDALYNDIPPDDPFWQVVIGDPTPEFLFDGAVYARGAMTLQALRNTVGDDAFFTILRRWVVEQGGGNGSTDEFIALAERVSGQDLGALFDAWLFTPGRPDLAFTGSTLRAAPRATAKAPASPSRLVKSLLERVHGDRQPY